MMLPFVPSRWQGAILVCGKCTRRVGGGFGAKGRTSLAKILRREGVGGRGRKARLGIVETGCLKLCPKNAVVAIDTRSPGDWLLICPGTAAEELVRRFDRTIAPPEGRPA